MSYSTAYRGPAIETDVLSPWDVGHRMRDLRSDVATDEEDSTDRRMRDVPGEWDVLEMGQAAPPLPPPPLSPPPTALPIG